MPRSVTRTPPPRARDLDPLGDEPVPAAPPEGVIVLSREGPATEVGVPATAPSELVLDLTLSSPGVDWSRRGAESAVVSIAVDGRHATDVLAFGEEPLTRTVALGRVGPGEHVVALRLSADHSPAGAREAWLWDVELRVVGIDQPAALVLRHAPVLFGRTLPWFGSRSQNARTDTPLVGWHELRPAATPGHRVIEYSAVWSGEDGGTSPPASMARWGRTTDIEWIYRVEVDRLGNRVPGTAWFQGPAHTTRRFTGRHEADHPLLKTCTSNNNFCLTLPLGARMRFMLGHEATRPRDRAREVLMDQNPWTYQVMAKELVREGRLETVDDPDTPAVGDPRTYLYVEVDKDTVDPHNQPGASVGLAVGVRLHGSPTVYRSDHGRAEWSIERDDAAATAVELPPEATAPDIAEIVGIRVPVGSDTGSTVTVRRIHRAFFLGARCLPQPSFVAWEGAVVLTAAQPRATIWTP